MKKVLLVSDGQDWIVDRICAERVKRMPFDFLLVTRSLTPEALVILSKEFDLVHYANWGIKKYMNVIDQIETKQIMSVLSHRTEPWVQQIAEKMDKVHVVNPMLREQFPGAVYIPDGIFITAELIKERSASFRVGMAFQNTPANAEYKGYPIVAEACRRLGVTLDVASEKKPSEMAEWLASLNLYVCASEAEGFSTMVMECVALNVPVITTRVGVPSLLNVHTIDRDVNSIMEGIGRFYTAPQVETFTWENSCNAMTQLYGGVIND